ncbi:class I SAM-dependent methyltransferase [Patescibacteria group bacterium]|nr:class I SAM-dependent methyltransferase [Patescibacteria group bacterium]
MDYKKQKVFFKNAYDLGEKRISAGYGWPLEVDPQLPIFLKDIQKSLQSGKVLDLGCGQGRHTIFFAQNGFDAYGIDYLERPIEEAKELAKEKGLSSTHFLKMDIFQLDFPKNFFDIMLDWSILDHISPQDWDMYLKNILDSLKIGGFLILTEFSANDERVKEKEKNFAMDRDSYDHYFKEDEIRDMFSKNFEIIEINETLLETAPPHLMINVLMRRKS